MVNNEFPQKSSKLPELPNTNQSSEIQVIKKHKALKNNFHDTRSVLLARITLRLSIGKLLESDFLCKRILVLDELNIYKLIFDKIILK